MAISLSKGQSIDLRKQAPGLTRVRMGLGWDPVKKGGFFKRLSGRENSPIDLDASCLLYDSARRLGDAVWYGQLQSRDGSVKHSGDNLTGDGDGDDETIFVDLTRLASSVAALVFTVNSFRGQTFDEVDNAVCRLVDDVSGREIARFDLRERGAHTGVVMAVLSRVGDTWSMKAVGKPANGRSARDMDSFASAEI
ncbi:TerD family protein [Methylobacterium oryzihabitans]|uniref:TerD family protein n=1 Tax=Methylobacterium oryzihabitans TaxID=2499852 RepID=A0A3S2VNF3_9HYPH|nr:TerD family protein [Methylobacterium oryzihabitans]RVU16887.1 TerD family protein [Methylobacterium oryzihabitans]